MGQAAVFKLKTLINMHMYSISTPRSGFGPLGKCLECQIPLPALVLSCFLFPLVKMKGHCAYWISIFYFGI